MKKERKWNIEGAYKRNAKFSVSKYKKFVKDSVKSAFHKKPIDDPRLIKVFLD